MPGRPTSRTDALTRCLPTDCVDGPAAAPAGAQRPVSRNRTSRSRGATGGGTIPGPSSRGAYPDRPPAEARPGGVEPRDGLLAAPGRWRGRGAGPGPARSPRRGRCARHAHGDEVVPIPVPESRARARAARPAVAQTITGRPACGPPARLREVDVPGPLRRGPRSSRSRAATGSSCTPYPPAGSPRPHRPRPREPGRGCRSGRAPRRKSPRPPAGRRREEVAGRAGLAGERMRLGRPRHPQTTSRGPAARPGRQRQPRRHGAHQEGQGRSPTNPAHGREAQERATGRERVAPRPRGVRLATGSGGLGPTVPRASGWSLSISVAISARRVADHGGELDEVRGRDGLHLAQDVEHRRSADGRSNGSVSRPSGPRLGSSRRPLAGDELELGGSVNTTTEPVRPRAPSSESTFRL